VERAATGCEGALSGYFVLSCALQQGYYDFTHYLTVADFALLEYAEKDMYIVK